ncbi:hypothetical protein [Streptomyces sp. NPDC058426]|uniref:hypothetical protein n=1 Tax=Streptomyces sp. NPDC058426 TaxID=3346493 RepID=UPI00364ED49C
MGAATYWAAEIKKADKTSPKAGALRRMDRLRGALGKLDPAVANRAWGDVGDDLQKVLDRYSR